MALTDYEIAQLTSVHGVGRAEAKALGAVLNAIAANAAPETLPNAARLAVLQLGGVSLTSREAVDLITALQNCVAGTPAASQDAHVAAIFARRLASGGALSDTAFTTAIYAAPAPAVSCANAFAVTGPQAAGFNFSVMTFSGADSQTAMATLTGVAGGFLAAPDITAIPAYDITTGIRVVEIIPTFPASTAAGADVQGYTLTTVVGTAQFGTQVSVQFTAQNNGTINLTVTVGAAQTQVMGITAMPARVGIEINATAGTARVLLDNVPVTLTAGDTFTPVSAILIGTVYEQAAVDAADVGKVVGFRLVTSASDITGTAYAVGATDFCGNAL